MHLLNFLFAISLAFPYVAIYSRLAIPDSIPVYFLSEEAKLMACEFYIVVLYWAGFLRNMVFRGTISERTYFLLALIALGVMCATKIIFALPYTWILSLFAFGLGVLSATSGQTIGNKSLFILILLSLILISYAGFILIGMAWFDFKPTDYYYYQLLIEDWLGA